MKLQTCDRNGCHTIRRYLRYERIMRDYRCAACGRALEKSPLLDNYVVVSYEIVCPVCGVITDISHYNEVYFEQLDADEVMDALPAEFRALVSSSNTTPLDLDAITQALF